MGFFGKLFEKKVCNFCGEEIGLLGNRKLEDGNMCKTCANKLSPWFDDRRHSTVEQIGAQLEYREANKAAVAAFNTTCSLGGNTKVLIDEDKRKFMVTSASNLAQANPDVLDFSQVTGVDLDIDDGQREEKYKDKEGNYVSYNPPRYTFYYDFHVVIRVNHPYFDDSRFRLNPSNVELNPYNPLPTIRRPNPNFNPDYREYEAMGKEIKAKLTEARQQVRDEVAAAKAPKMAVNCPYCGATTVPDANGCCEYCGGSVNG